MPKNLVDFIEFNKKIIKNVIPLPAERYYGAEDIGVPWWVKFDSGDNCVEGILHLSNLGKKLLIFEPGFPGDGSARLEKLHIKKILEAGFSVFAARHNATIINGKYSDSYINCIERQEYAKSEGQFLLGKNQTASITDWLEEPRVSISALSGMFDEIYLLGHSFGVLAILFSLIELVEADFSGINKIVRIVSLSGATGRVRGEDDRIIRQWMEHLDTESVRERIKIGDISKNIESLSNAYKIIHSKANNIPQKIDFIYVSPWGDNKENLDELVSPLEAIDFISTLGRGSLVIDKTQHSDGNGRMVHDMDSLETEILIDFLNGAMVASKSVLTVLK